MTKSIQLNKKFFETIAYMSNEQLGLMVRNMTQEANQVQQIKIVDTNPEWWTNFNLYLEELYFKAEKLLSNSEWLTDREKYHPFINVRLTVEKAINDFWGTVKGWEHKKASKTKTIDWESTLNGALSIKTNQVTNVKTKIPSSNSNWTRR